MAVRKPAREKIEEQEEPTYSRQHEAAAQHKEEGKAYVREEIREQVRQMLHNRPDRVVALNRKGEPVSRASAASGVDGFHIPPGIKPNGWSWEWKRVTVAQQPDPAYTAQLSQVGWEPVLAESYPGVFAPMDHKGAIIRSGLMLMERPQALTDEARREETAEANLRVGNAVRKHALNTAGAHGVSLDTAAAKANTYVRKQYENVPNAPPNYQRGGPAVD